jgi:hypothetical protein
MWAGVLESITEQNPVESGPEEASVRERSLRWRRERDFVD